MLMYELWTLTAEEMRSLELKEARMLRWMCIVSAHTFQSISEKSGLREIKCSDKREDCIGSVM